MGQVEFEFIQNLKSKFSLTNVGDDCAVLPKDEAYDLLLTADLLVEDIDFRLDWTTPEYLGHKSLAVSLSDIAAMGGQPDWSILSIGIPERLWKTSFLDLFYEGWFALARKFKVELVGGDISRTPDKVVIDSIVGGNVGKGRAVPRSTAKPGDVIFVTGTLGGAAGGLVLLESGSRIDSENPNGLILKQLQPTPQLFNAKLLQELCIATSMIDISDGLSSDLMHICEASRVGASIFAASLPINADLPAYFSANECFDMSLNGGEDFELLFTVSESNIPHVDPSKFTCIGVVTTDTGNIELITDDGVHALNPKGFRHF